MNLIDYFMDKIGKILHSSLAKSGIGKEAVAAEICYWADKMACGEFRALSFLNGTLKISVSSSTAASEVQIKEEGIIESINEKIGKKLIKKIRIMVIN
jgi:hypothetical protein